MHDKIISILLVLYGSYLTTIGFLNTQKNKKILSVFELVDLYIVKVKEGTVAYENRKSDLLESYKHKIFAKSFLFLGIISLLLGLFLWFQ